MSFQFERHIYHSLQTFNDEGFPLRSHQVLSHLSVIMASADSWVAQ